MSQLSEDYKAYYILQQAVFERAPTNASCPNISAKYSISVDKIRSAYKQWGQKTTTLHPKNLDQIHFDLRKKGVPVCLTVRLNEGITEWVS